MRRSSQRTVLRLLRVLARVALRGTALDGDGLPFAGAFKQIVEALFVLHVPGGTQAGNVVTASRVLSGR